MFAHSIISDKTVNLCSVSFLSRSRYSSSLALFFCRLLALTLSPTLFVAHLFILLPHPPFSPVVRRRRIVCRKWTYIAMRCCVYLAILGIAFLFFFLLFLGKQITQHQRQGHSHRLGSIIVPLFRYLYRSSYCTDIYYN